MTYEVLEKQIDVLSDEAMQELLYVELLQKIWESFFSQASSPYYKKARHLNKLLKLFSVKKSIRLGAKTNRELALFLEQLQKVASEVVSSNSFSGELKECAREFLKADSTVIEAAISFGRRYYSSCLDRFR